VLRQSDRRTPWPRGRPGGKTWTPAAALRSGVAAAVPSRASSYGASWPASAKLQPTTSSMSGRAPGHTKTVSPWALLPEV